MLTAMVTLTPTTVSASPGQQPPAPNGSSPTLVIDVDVSTDEVGDVAGTLDELIENVSEQLGELREAQAELEGAEDDLDEAQELVVETEGEISELTALSDQLVTEAFVNPPVTDSIDTLVSTDMSEVAMKQALLRIRADGDASILDELDEARDELEERKAAEEERAAAAEHARELAAAELDDLQAAVDQQTDFLLGVEARLERGSSEAIGLEEMSPELAEELRGERDALTSKLRDVLDAREYAEAMEALAAAAEARAEREAAEAAEAAAAAEREAAEAASSEPADLGPASGNLSTVNCPNGGSITVDSSLSGNLSQLLSAASADGIQLCGGGYRDPQRQIELRRAHCGTSHYAIYEMPSSQCSPPTARPGTSMHERGLAIDFNCNGGSAISSQSSPCFVWLNNNAARFGLYNLPVEPWHWSTNGN